LSQLEDDECAVIILTTDYICKAIMMLGGCMGDYCIDDILSSVMARTEASMYEDLVVTIRSERIDPVAAAPRAVARKSGSMSLIQRAAAYRPLRSAPRRAH
jgi:hypothetical protein